MIDVIYRRIHGVVGVSTPSWAPASVRGMEDPLDARLAAEVSRATLAVLSERVGLSASAVQARLRRLEARGVITGYRALLDPEAVGRPLAVFVEITPLDPRQTDDAPALLGGIPAIEACHSVAGDAACMLFVRVGSPRELEALVTEIRQTASVSTRTTVVLQTFYEHRPMLPVPEEVEEGTRG